MKQTNGRLNGRYILPHSTPDMAVLRASCSFSDRIEAFLESACPRVSVISLHQLLEADRPDHPLLVCLIGDTLDEEMWHSLAEMRAHCAAAPLLLFLRRSTVPDVTRAMRMGVFEILVEPIVHPDVMHAINEALDLSANTRQEQLNRQDVLDRLNGLTPRMREMLELLQAGMSNRKVAAKLGMSPKTVDRHRRQLKEKMRVKSFVELIRIVAAAQAGTRGSHGYNSSNGLKSTNGLNGSHGSNGLNGPHLKRSLLTPASARDESSTGADIQHHAKTF